MSDELTLDEIIALVQQQDAIGYDERIRLVQEIESLTAERDAMQDMVDRLPRTEDGVPVVPTIDKVFFVNAYTGNVNKLPLRHGGHSGYGVYARSEGGFAMRWYKMGECYSTREAAMRQTRKENDDE